MTNLSEIERWIKDARASLASAEKALQASDFRVAVQNAQLCIELAAKSVIAFFAEPAWRHDPGKQLSRLLKEQVNQSTLRLDASMRQLLEQLAREADDVAPWHGWSMYGRSEEDDNWIPAIDLCTQPVAEDLVARARRSFDTANIFIQCVTSGAGSQSTST